MNAPEVAVRHEGRDELGRFAPGTTITRRGSINKLTRTMRADALDMLAAAGPAGNPLIQMYEIASAAETPLRVRAWLWKELARAIFGDVIKQVFEMEAPDEITEERIATTRKMLAMVFAVEKTE
jgi:hypothetical protein